jgi:hypothetical protein
MVNSATTCVLGMGQRLSYSLKERNMGPVKSNVCVSQSVKINFSRTPFQQSLNKNNAWYSFIA